jgi:hypothetical protein
LKDVTKIVGISTCKGRLEFIQQSSIAFINASPDNVKYLLVDYGCPQKTGQWVKNNLPASKAFTLELNPSNNIFHKTIALNAGAKYAINNLGAEYLLFFDADTIIKPGLIEQITSLLEEDKCFIFVDTNEENKDLTGFLVVHKKLFRESGGYEESFRDWGAEDLEFRLRLYAKHKRPFKLITGEFLDSIPHDDSLRTQFYSEKNSDLSNERNYKRMRKMFALYRIGEDIKMPQNMEDRLLIEKLVVY